jgi:tetratricopeptide (TPR) repeat protein
MFSKKICITFLMILAVFKAVAVGKFELSAKARVAYNQALSLRFEEASASIAALKVAEPNNLMVHFIENYIDCLKVFLDEDEDELHRLESNKDKRLAFLKKGDPKSPYCLYTQAHIRLMWAMSRLKFNEYLTAMREVSAAFSDLETNQRLFPSFMPNKQALGVLHSIASNIPDNYKSVVKLVSGLNGTAAQGQAELEEVIQYAQKSDYAFEQEALIMYATTMLYLNGQPHFVWKIINNGRLKVHDNPMACLSIASIAMKTGHNDKAIELLENRPTGNQYYPCWFLEYNLGLAKLFRGDSDAPIHLQKYVDHFKGRNYIKEAYQKLAWNALLINDLESYKKLMSQCKTQGSLYMDGDKQANREAKSGVMPDPTILRGRLFFDGGYYNKALTAFQSKKASDFPTHSLKLEYLYRLGRVYQMVGRRQEAVDAFFKTIQDGRDKPFYYACSAALQMGIIYEEGAQIAEARKYYQICLDITPPEFGDGLHLKAKTGLNRLKNSKM